MMPPRTTLGWINAHGVIMWLCLLGQLLVVLSKQSLPLPQFRSMGQEFGPMCVKAKREVCAGKPRSYQTVGTILNGSYQAPELADMNGDGRLDLITVHTGNNSVMIFYNQGYGSDHLPVFEAAASVIVPSNRTIRAVHAMATHTSAGAAPSGPFLLLSMEIEVHGDLIIPMLDNIGTATEPQLVWRYGDESFLRSVDLKEAFTARGIYANLLEQATDISVLLGVGDMDADGDLDLVVQLTWLTLYYENVGLPSARNLTYLERPDVNLLSTSLRFFAPPLIFDMDNDGDNDIISFVGDRLHGTSAVVYENIGTKYYPEMHGLDSHPIADLYKAVCTGDYSDCSLRVNDYNRDGHKDILAGGADVGGIHVYPQGRSTIFLYDTKRNHQFSILQSDSSTFSFQDLLDVDGDGDLDMYVSSWLINPVRTVQVQAYENQGTTAEPTFVLRSTFIHTGGLSYFSPTVVLNRTNAQTGLPIYDFLLTNGSETVYVLCNNNLDNLNITNLTEPEPLFEVGCPAGRVYFFDDNADGKPEMFVLNAYGDLDGMLESQLYTTSSESRPLFQEEYQQSCNRINLFHDTGTTSWRDGISRPVFTPNGSVTFNFTGCISDIELGDYEDKTKPAMMAIAVPQGRVYRFETRTWSGRDTLMELTDGAEFTEARVEADTPISLCLVDLDRDGRYGLMVSYAFSVRRWRNDYCQLEFPCWKGGKCDLTLFTPKCDCSSGFTGDLCDTCAENHFGRNCESCPTDQAGSVCSSKGFCHWGDFAPGCCMCTRKKIDILPLDAPRLIKAAPRTVHISVMQTSWRRQDSPDTATIIVVTAPFSGTNCSEGVCPVGREASYNYKNATFECVLCKSAHYKDHVGNEPCDRCPPFSRASDDRTTCNCDSDYYLGEADGMLACKECPAPMITIKEAATSIHECVCPAGYYLVSEAATTNGPSNSIIKANSIGTCMPCPEGAACTVPGITLETLPLLPNYWRISNTSASIGRCKLLAACPGTDLGQWKHDVWLKGGEWRGFEESLCGAGYDGPFCSACAPGHFKRNRRCLPCAPKAVTTRHVVLGFVAVAILALGAWLAYRRVVTPHLQRVFNVEPEPQPTVAQLQPPSTTTHHNRPHALSTAANPVLRSPIRNSNEYLDSGALADPRNRSMSTREVVLALPAVYKRVRAVVGVKLRLLIIYLQVVSCLWNILDLDASEDTPIDDVMSALQWFNLNFAAIPSYQCALGDNYYDNLLVYTYGPVLVVALIWGGTLLLCERAKWAVNKVDMYRDYATTASLGLCFLLFAGGSTRLLNFFACVRLDDGHLYNTSDMRVRCDVASYQGMVPLVVIGILLYPIGITCLYAYLLYTDRARICARPDKSVGEMIALRNADALAKRSRFLWSPYEPRVWWFEVAECIRRLSLTAFLSVYQTGKTQQSVAAILLSVLSIIVFDHYMPYLSAEDDAMGKVCNYVTLLAFLVALLTKLEFIRRVYITELLLFLLALSAAACGVALAVKQLSDPAPLPYVNSALGRRRSSLMSKKHLKPIDAAEAIARIGLRGSDDGASPSNLEPQAEEATLAPSTVQLDGARLLRQRDQLGPTGRALSTQLPPLPSQPARQHHHPVPSQHEGPSPSMSKEPDATPLSTTYNALLQCQLGSSGGAWGGGERRSLQFNDSGSSQAAMLRETGRPSAEGGSGAAVIAPEYDYDAAPRDTQALTARFISERARVDPATPPPPSDAI